MRIFPFDAFAVFHAVANHTGKEIAMADDGYAVFSAAGQHGLKGGDPLKQGFMGLADNSILIHMTIDMPPIAFEVIEVEVRKIDCQFCCRPADIAAPVHPLAVQGINDVGSIVAKNSARCLDRTGKGRADDQIIPGACQRLATFGGLLVAKRRQGRINNHGVLAGHILKCVESGLAVANEVDNTRHEGRDSGFGFLW